MKPTSKPLEPFFPTATVKSLVLNRLATAPRQAEGPRYPLSVNRLRTFLERLSGGRRPPTGPLTTSEAADAEELQQEMLAKDGERIERAQEEAGRESNSSS